MNRVKEIKLAPAIGTWYEYKPKSITTDAIILGSLEQKDIDNLLDIHYHWGLATTELYTQKLNIPVALHKVKITQIKYQDFLSSYGEGVVYKTFDVGNAYEGNVFASAKAVSCLIDAASGGSGIVDAKANGDFSALERTAAKVVVNDIFTLIDKEWLAAITSNRNAELLGSKIKVSEKIKKDQDVFVVEVEIAVSTYQTVSFGIMYPITQLVERYEAYRDARLRQPRPATIQLAPESLKGTDVPVQIKIGQTTVTMNDLLLLQSGDIFMLNEKLADTVFFSAGEGDYPAEFYGILGKRNDRYAVKIIERKSLFADEQTPLTMNAKATTAQEKARPVVAEMPRMAAMTVDTPIEVAPVAYVTEETLIADTTTYEQTAAAPIELPPLPQQEIDTAAVQLTADNKIDENTIEIKDTLLEELSTVDTASNTDDEFTWDLDDLK